MKKILFLAANPQGTTKLALEKEVDEIEEGLKQSDIQIQIVKLSEVRTQDLRRALIREKPDILHFSGHGEGQAGLILTDDAGQLKRVSSSALAELFDFFAEQVKCVVLNACYSKDQAEAIVQHIDYVIGMRQEVKDHVAIQFSIGFYDALGSGLSIEKAFKMGCNAIHLESSNSDARSQAERTLIPTRKAVQKTVLDHLIPDLWRKIDHITSSDALNSGCGVDYTTLRNLLAVKKWREADEETESICQLLLSRREVNALPCEDIWTMDQLWMKYSDRRFGFSVQKRIWQSIGGTNQTPWSSFCQQVGWLVQLEQQVQHKSNWFSKPSQNVKWLTVLEIRDGLINEPGNVLSSGHLPSFLQSKTLNSLPSIEAFFYRLQECRL